jgi:prophage regulatory protein
MQQLLRFPQVRERVGLSRSEVNRLIALNRFPRPVPLGARAVAWVSEEIDAFVRARIAARESERMAA